MKFRKKLMLSFLLLVVFMFIVNFFSFDPLIKSFFMDESMEVLVGQSKLAKLLLMEDRSPGASPQALAVKMGGALDARITIIDPGGRVIGDSALKESELKRLENHLHRPEVQAALRSGFGQAVRYSDTLKASMLYAAAAFDGGTSHGVVRVSHSLGRLNARLNRLHQLAGGILLLSMLAAFGLSFVISRIVSRPLVEMAAYASEISGRETFRQVAIGTSDEIGDLARALNTMGERIKAQMSEQESEKKRLDVILRGMGEGLMVVLADGTISLVNPPFQSLFSFDGDEEGKNIREILDSPELIATFEEISEFGKELVWEFHIQAAGTTLLTHWVPLRVDGGGEGIVVVFHDITERKQYEDALGKSEERFRSIVEGSLTGMHFLALDLEGGLELVGANPAADRIVGISHWPLLSSSVEEAFPGLRGAPILDLYRKVAVGELGPQSLEHELRFGATARYYDLRLFQTGPLAITVEFADITERKLLQDELRHLSEKDPLTSIYNRRKLYELLTLETQRAERHERPLALILLDIDHFKTINDTYGHDMGDVVLTTLAEVVTAELRSTDIFARYGGEEFVVVCPETDMDGAFVLAEKIRVAIENYRFPAVGEVTISAGVSGYVSGDGNNRFVKRADQALYVAKETGRDRVVKGTS